VRQRQNRNDADAQQRKERITNSIEFGNWNTTVERPEAGCQPPGQPVDRVAQLFIAHAALACTRAAARCAARIEPASIMGDVAQ
jgi:hypothetical protein